MLRSSSHFRGNVLHLLHRGTTSSPQNVYRSVDISIVVRTTFRTCPLSIRERKILVVMSTIRTRLRCRSPLSDLTELTIMFETLELQYLNKLPEGKVGNFAAPEAFHALKVQRLSDDKVKSPTQVRGKFEMPISTLIRNFAIQPHKFSDSTPPIVRTFDFTRKAFVEFAKFGQGLFQELWRLYLFARVQCQKCVFHTEVCTYTFTRSRQYFFRGIIGHDIKPIGTDSITKDLDIANIPFPIAMVMKRKPAFVEFKGLRRCVPGFKRETDTTFFNALPSNPHALACGI